MTIPGPVAPVPSGVAEPPPPSLPPSPIELLDLPPSYLNEERLALLVDTLGQILKERAEDDPYRPAYEARLAMLRAVLQARLEGTYRPVRVSYLWRQRREA